jgi:hypothetical protein
LKNRKGAAQVIREKFRTSFRQPTEGINDQQIMNGRMASAARQLGFDILA